MSSETLQKVIDVIAAEPRSAAALILYALVSTLEFERAGFLFKLDKLRGLDASQRRLAYDLMEMMVSGQNQGEAWSQAKTRLDALVRGV